MFQHNLFYLLNFNFSTHCIIAQKFKKSFKVSFCRFQRCAARRRNKSEAVDETERNVEPEMEEVEPEVKPEVAEVEPEVRENGSDEGVLCLKRYKGKQE